MYVRHTKNHNVVGVLLVFAKEIMKKRTALSLSLSLALTYTCSRRTLEWEKRITTKTTLESTKPNRVERKTKQISVHWVWFDTFFFSACMYKSFLYTKKKLVFFFFSLSRCDLPNTKLRLQRVVSNQSKIFIRQTKNRKKSLKIIRIKCTYITKGVISCVCIFIMFLCLLFCSSFHWTESTAEYQLEQQPP